MRTLVATLGVAALALTTAACGEDEPAAGDGGGAVGAQDGAGGDELVGDPEFADAHGDEGVAGGISSAHGDVAGESCCCHAGGDAANQCADVAGIHR